MQRLYNDEIDKKMIYWAIFWQKLQRFYVLFFNQLIYDTIAIRVFQAHPIHPRRQSG